MEQILSIAFFGALGCLARYFLSGWVYDLCGRAFPYGTFVVNVIGAFLIGLIMEFSIRSVLISPTLRTALTIGFLGGLTTFSTFSFETFRLIEEGAVLNAFGNILSSVVACLACTWLGIVVARAL
ncbi:putative fluoride ion transporter CrcB [Geomonas limicola]|uniref:Fluoride-specific ion channel FluC n=1 Tax=Geomonas limicola TaxID=2740186 RepID=A0A6V8N9B7_9BACT|nr:fluoride efflux transporter CrcB [Geomonas limicola]GFO68387.1 putative fluoride ion transporter CrcB [Geomonas limicola]